MSFIQRYSPDTLEGKLQTLVHLVTSDRGNRIKVDMSAKDCSPNYPHGCSVRFITELFMWAGFDGCPRTNKLDKLKAYLKKTGWQSLEDCNNQGFFPGVLPSIVCCEENVKLVLSVTVTKSGQYEDIGKYGEGYLVTLGKREPFSISLCVVDNMSTAPYNTDIDDITDIYVRPDERKIQPFLCRY